MSVSNVGLQSIANRAARDVRNVVLLAGILAFVEKPAAAYVDPGAGSWMWQMIMAAVVGSLFYFRRITAWLRGISRWK